MRTIKNIPVCGSEGRPMATDIIAAEDTTELKPVVIYVHGFNGFKDWGNFDLVANQFAQAGFIFVKFNFSHNGTTLEATDEFVDIESFGNNNYTKELNDLGNIIEWVLSQDNPFLKITDPGRIFLLGHSRGGGIAILKAAEDHRVKKLITWASVDECKTPWGSWASEKMEMWRKSGVEFYVNGRTKQKLPLYYQLYRDYTDNAERLNVEQAISILKIPVLVCHGNQDTAVPFEKAYQLKEWQPNAELLELDSDHVFGRKHPWPGKYLPETTQQAVTESIEFLKRQER